MYIDFINFFFFLLGKLEIDVVVDYFFKFCQVMRVVFQKILGEVFNCEERNICYYLIVFVIWNDVGKVVMRVVVIQVGFFWDENDNCFILVSEFEVVVLFCFKIGFLNFKVYDVVLIVDCGGGIVDLIVYEVEDENFFIVVECMVGFGDFCGLIVFNCNFSNIFCIKIWKMKLFDGFKMVGCVYVKCIMDFENCIKVDFWNNGQKWVVDVGIEVEFLEVGIEEGYMIFINEEIL